MKVLPGMVSLLKLLFGCASHHWCSLLLKESESAIAQEFNNKSLHA